MGILIPKGVKAKSKKIDYFPREFEFPRDLLHQVEIGQNSIFQLV